MLIKKPLTVVYLAGFFFSARAAFMSFINSSYLSTEQGCNCGITEDFVGILYTLGSVVSLLMLAYASLIVKKIGNRRSSLLALSIMLLAVAGMISFSSAWVTGGLFVVFLGVVNLVYFNLDLMIEHYSSNSNTGNTRGLFLTIINVGWVVSPFIVGQLLETAGGFNLVYIIALVLGAITLALLGFCLPKYKEASYTHKPLMPRLKSFWKTRALRKIGIVNFALNFFYATMVIYIPIYLNQDLGIGWGQLGIIFTIMLLPFVLLEFPLGHLADKKYGEKEMLVIGLIVLAVSTLLVSFVTAASILIWGLILFATRVGASTLEVLSESYFFKHVDEKDIDNISIFRNAKPLAYIIAPLGATLLLSVFSIELRWIFAVLAGMVFFIAVYNIASLVDTK